MVKERRTRPSFFKVLLGDFSRRLKIPPDFVKHFKGNRHKKFILQSTNGKSWRVRLKKINNSWFLQRGWQHFVMYHSLQVGEFLVFKFNGKSKFWVTVYDRSACEKELPLAKRRNCDHDEEKPIYHIKKEEDEDEEEEEAIAKPNKAAVVPWKANCGAVVPAVERGIKGNKELQAVISSFKTEHPHFIHVLRHSRRYYVTVPRALAYKFGLVGKGSTVLEVPDGRISQRVKISQKKDGRISLTTGWFVFQKANNMANGDACIFEFIERGMDNAICVHIFRAPPPPPPPEIVVVDPGSCCASATETDTETIQMLTYGNGSDDETGIARGNNKIYCDPSQQNLL
ncbi:putative B3 domain-containing protein Os03g0621600 isoform X2 [Macadamia integrifolia]|uniref:putative B3 domain-containing protein Os03g0621600 isoform X2 n=1 Tax=Macadamia integrifolia TaxID=60698 RepID=UPI001C4E3DF7|nr:putative B3 domain-containing protein Os03g0621600 isoform X2 [Macadamia integrifolia]